MGNNSVEGGSGNNNNQNYDELKEYNNSIIDEILEQDYSKRFYESEMREIAEYCAKNGIELLNTTLDPDHYYHSDSGIPAVAFIDPDTGKEIWVHGNYIQDYQVNSFNKGLVEGIDEIRKSLTQMPEGYTDKLNTVSLCTENDRYLGYFWGYYPNNIHLSSRLFSSNTQKTGVIGTVVHELTHLNEYQNYGYSGANRIFSNNPDLFPENKPTRYGTVDPTENITTLVEQVYTHTLRNDAQMKDGTLVNEAFYTKYKRYPQTQEDRDMMYEMWEDEWYPAIVETKDWINGGFKGKNN